MKMPEVLALALIAAACCPAAAQVYRCENGGKVEYRATPCPDGEATRTLEGNTRPADTGQSSKATQGGTPAKPAPGAEPEFCKQSQQDYEFANRQVHDAIDALQRARTQQGLQAFGLRDLENEIGRARIGRSMIVRSASACAFTKTGNAAIIKSNKALTWEQEFDMTAEDLRKCDALLREARTLRGRNKRPGGQPRGTGLMPPGTNIDDLRKEWEVEDQMDKMHCQQEWR